MRARVVLQQQYFYTYLFAVACDNSGQIEAIITSFNNIEVITECLSLITKETAINRHVVIPITLNK